MAAFSCTAVFTLHWGGEKGGTTCQICKKGGKTVFSQENRGRKGALLPVLTKAGSEMIWASHLTGLWWDRGPFQSAEIARPPKAEIAMGDGKGARTGMGGPRASTPGPLGFAMFHSYPRWVPEDTEGLHPLSTAKHETGKRHWTDEAAPVGAASAAAP